ncbi:hypothetical protein AAZX31_06G088700 [Glycine max]
MYFYLSAEVTRVQTPAVMGTTASYHIRLLSLNHVLRIMHETYHQGVPLQIIALTRNQHLS